MPNGPQLGYEKPKKRSVVVVIVGDWLDIKLENERAFSLAASRCEHE